MLGDAVEEHREEAAVHQPRRAFVDHGKGDAAGRGVGVEMVEGVLGKARVVRADVEGVIQVHPLGLGALRPDPRCRVGRCGGAASSRSHSAICATHGVDRRMLVFQREQQPGQPPQRPGGGDGLRQRLLTEPGGALGHELPFACRLFRQDAFLANLYRIAILYA